MKGDLTKDFIEYVKERFGREIRFEPSDIPDTFESIFGTSFISENKKVNIVEKSSIALVYNNKCANIIFSNKEVSEVKNDNSLNLAA